MPPFNETAAHTLRFWCCARTNCMKMHHACYEMFSSHMCPASWLDSSILGNMQTASCPSLFCSTNESPEIFIHRVAVLRFAMACFLGTNTGLSMRLG